MRVSQLHYVTHSFVPINRQPSQPTLSYRVGKELGASPKSSPKGKDFIAHPSGGVGEAPLSHLRGDFAARAIKIYLTDYKHFPQRRNQKKPEETSKRKGQK